MCEHFINLVFVIREYTCERKSNWGSIHRVIVSVDLQMNFIETKKEFFPTGK
uniref:Uncharacterized protein n=1 Tax=Rhizophagus irregularis (strain DAOM 181602 / DAOM 197198 / MUCL 43194) TaxID=747089 RepID=U9SUS0_RHIID